MTVWQSAVEGASGHTRCVRCLWCWLPAAAHGSNAQSSFLSKIAQVPLQRMLQGTSQGKLRALTVSTAAFAVVAIVAFVGVYAARGSENAGPQELLSPLQVGRYAVRAERQSNDYDQKAERQIAFATDNDNAAAAERDLAAKEEKRARDSAYLAADEKSTIDKILEDGRDQVGRNLKVSPHFPC